MQTAGRIHWPMKSNFVNKVKGRALKGLCLQSNFENKALLAVDSKLVS